MFYRGTGALGAFLIVFASSSAVFSGEKDDTPTYSSVVYSEYNFARGGEDDYSTLITAFNRDLDRDGFLFRAEGSLDRFEYDATLNAALTKIDGTEWQGGAFLGYQVIRADINYSAFAGLDYQSVSLSPFDPTNPVHGERAGFKVIGDIETEKEKPFYANLVAEYSTAFDTYFARARAGLKFGPGVPEKQVAIGPEGVFLGDQSYDAQRAGLFVLIPLDLKPLGSMEMIVSGGYQWVSGNGSTAASMAGGAGGYGTISFAMPF